METFKLEINAQITVTIIATSQSDAIGQIERAYAERPPVLLVDGEDVIYDFAIVDYDVLDDLS
jgi:hypothetical protein